MPTFRKTKALRKDVGDLKEQIAGHEQAYRDLVAANVETESKKAAEHGDAMAALKNEYGRDIADMGARISRLQADLNVQRQGFEVEKARLEGQLAEALKDASLWHSILPHARWLRVTSVPVHGIEADVWQPYCGECGEAALFTMRILMPKGMTPFKET